MVETGGVGGIDLKFVTIATHPRYGVVNVKDCNITTSYFGHTSQTG